MKFLLVWTQPYSFFALRRLIARSGNVRSVYSDNKRNFISAERDLERTSFMEDFGGD